MVIIYALAAVITGAIIVMVFLSHLKMFKLTSQTPGVIVRAENRVVRDDRERREETVVVCRYTVMDKEYEVAQVYRGRRAARFPVGRPVVIRYNPAEPAMAAISLA